MKECPKCHTMIEDDAVFCGVCGTKQETEEVEAQAEEQSSQEEQFCVHCGKEIEVGSLFCPYCGKPQDVEETKSEEPQPKEEEPAPKIEEAQIKEEPKMEESPKEEKKKLHTTSEKQEKQIDENALEKSILSMIKAHIKRFQEEEGKTIKSILKPKSYPNADIQLFSDANRQSVLKVVINGSVEGEKELYERLKDSKFFKMFVKEDSDSNEESLILDFHNDEEQAKNTILEILMTVYNQPKECAIGYVTNVSGYTMQEKGIEKSEKSSGCGCLIWILLALLIAGGAGWYFFLNDSSSQAVEEKVAIDSIMSSPAVDVNAPTSALAFLDQFYKGEYENDDYIKSHVTANVLNKLKRDCDYSDDCLATWVFSAFPAGADMNLEEGPIIRETEEKGKFRVVFVYSGYGENKPYYRNTVYLTVTEMDGKYLISDYELYIDEPSNEQEAQSSLFSNGTIRLVGNVSTYEIHMVLEASENHVTGYYYYDSQGSDNRVKLDGDITENNSLKLKKYDNKGMETGYFEGTFDDKTYHGFNVNYDRDSRRPFSVEIEE